MRLWNFQRDQVVAVSRELATRESTLVVSATGTGKSFTIAVCSEVHLRTGGGRALVLAPRDELIEQQRKAFLRVIPRLREIDVAIEKAEQRAAAGTPVVLASPQSLHRERLERFDPAEFSLVIQDEAHLGGDQLDAIFRHFAGAQRVGFTATPDRLDGRSLMPYPFESVAHVFDLPDAIEGGYLSPLKFQQKRIAELDLSGLRPPGADFTDQQVEAEMVRGETLAAAAQAVDEAMRAGSRKLLVFCASVAHSRLLAEVLGTRGIVAGAIDGSAPKGIRRDTLAAFRSGDLPVVCCCLLYTYGLDVPDLDTVVLARPTLSRALMSQMVGRVTRLAPGKEFGLVIDLVGNVGRHKLVTPAEALAPSNNPQVEAKRGVGGDEHDYEEEGQAIFDAETVLDSLDAEGVARQPVKLTTSSVDADLAIFGLDIPERVQGDRNATEAQIEALRKAGIQRPEFLSFDQASELFNQLAARRAEGLCTLKQGRLLARKGLNPNALFKKAEWAIEKIKANNWRTPPDVLVPGLVYRATAALRVKA